MNFSYGFVWISRTTLCMHNAFTTLHSPGQCIHMPARKVQFPRVSQCALSYGIIATAFWRQITSLAVTTYMIRQWTLPAVVHQRLPDSSLLHIAPVPVQYLHYQFIKAYQPKQLYIKPISTTPTKQKPHPQPQSCTASPPPLLAPPAPPTPASSPLYVHPPHKPALSMLLPSPSKALQLTTLATTDSPPIREQQHRRHRRRRRQGHREGRRGRTEGQGGHWPRHRTGTGQGQRGFGHCFWQGERACRPGAG